MTKREFFLFVATSEKQKNFLIARKTLQPPPPPSPRNTSRTMIHFEWHRIDPYQQTTGWTFQLKVWTFLTVRFCRRRWCPENLAVDCILEARVFKFNGLRRTEISAAELRRGNWKFFLSDSWLPVLNRLFDEIIIWTVFIECSVFASHIRARTSNERESDVTFFSFLYQIFEYCQFCMSRTLRIVLTLFTPIWAIEMDRALLHTHTQHRSRTNRISKHKNILVLCSAFIMQSFRRKRAHDTQFELKWITFTWCRWRAWMPYEAEWPYEERISGMWVEFEWITQKKTKRMWYAMRQNTTQIERMNTPFTVNTKSTVPTCFYWA